MFSVVPRSSICTPNKLSQAFPQSYRKFHPNWISISRRPHCTTKCLLSEKFPKVAAQSTGPVAASELIEVVKSAAQTGAEVCYLPPSHLRL